MANKRKITDIDKHRIEVFKKADSIDDASSLLGLKKTSIQSVRSRLEERYDIKLPRWGNGVQGKLRHVKFDSPFSEDAGKFKENWGPDECIKKLRKIVEAEPDKVITRNYFRVTSGISETTWNRYFGTFEEFKRQAGITLTRQQHNLERQLAKHASVDHYREMNIEKANWGETYVRKNNKNHQVGIICSDLHDIEVDPFYMEVLIDTIKRVQPDFINLNGDIFDLPEFSRFTVDPREWDVVGRIKFVHDFILAPIRDVAPDAQIDMNEGNHEYRLLKHLCDATPAMKAVLSDLHGFTISKLLGLEEYQINYIAKADLAAYTRGNINKEISRNYSTYFDCLVVHHFPEGKKLGMPGINGHHHKHLCTSLHNETFGSYEWHQNGCGHIRDATYCNGEIWNMGFMKVDILVDKRIVNFEYMTVSDIACTGGKYYYRGKKS